MNCTFYRPSTVNVREFENIVGKLAHDLYLLENEKQDEWGVYSYFYSLSCHCTGVCPVSSRNRLALLK